MANYWIWYWQYESDPDRPSEADNYITTDTISFTTPLHPHLCDVTCYQTCKESNGTFGRCSGPTNQCVCNTADDESESTTESQSDTVVLTTTKKPKCKKRCNYIYNVFRKFLTNW